MTNHELPHAPGEDPGRAERRRQYARRVESMPLPCPACLAPVSAATAAARDRDGHAHGRGGRGFRCPHCRAELEPAVPLFAASGPAWYWRLRYEWLADRLARAEVYDREHPGEGL